MASPYKKYLGDSVYADFDGYAIVLTTENGLPSDPSNTVVLEPQVMECLELYKTWLEARLKEQSSAKPK